MIKQVDIKVCDKLEAVEFIRAHHSRLPNTQKAPWQYAFGAYIGDCMVAAALWHNPSARMLPGHWLELRRLACSEAAPHNTASKMLGHMVRIFKKHCPEREKCISYQDVDVHTGTIYKASNWHREYFSRPRIRDRSKSRIGTKRNYRSDINSSRVAAAGKIRWACYLNKGIDKVIADRLSERVLLQASKVVHLTK